MITDEFAPSEQFQSDAALLCTARELSQTIYHPVGTCKMGHDPLAVVDAQLRVHGIAGLRCRRCLDHAADRLRQHQRPNHHDRRKSRRNDRPQWHA